MRSFDRYQGTAGDLPQSFISYLKSLFEGFDRILDVGCGKGQFLDTRTIGIDIDLAAIRNALGSVVQGDLDGSQLPFKDEVFDGVLAKDIIEHLARPRDLLRELHRTTRRGGRLVVLTPRDVPRAVWADYTHIRGFSRSALERLLADSGWEAKLIRRSGGLPLAGRLRIARFIPLILKLPGFGHYFGTNWEAIAQRR